MRSKRYALRTIDTSDFVGGLWDKMRRVGHVADMREIGKVQKCLIGEHVGKRPLGRPCMWENNIKIDLEEIRF
jgi:hypothetical protein